MKFSIIVPVYNVNEYLSTCLESILAQEYRDYEILLIDDGSTDGSGVICDKYARENENIVAYHKENSGLSDTRNYGIDRARGEYLIFVDSDDWIEEGCLKVFSEVLEIEKSDVLVTRFVDSYEDKEVYKDKEFEGYLKSEFTTERAREWILKYSEDAWPAQKYIVSADFVKRNNLKFAVGRLHEDIDWTSQICYWAKSYSGCAKEWYHHRLNRVGAITNSIKGKNITDVIEIAAKHYSYLENGMDRITESVFERIMKSVYVSIGHVKNCSKEEQKKVVKCIEKNRKIFRVAPSWKYKMFVILMKVLGIENSLGLLAKL